MSIKLLNLVNIKDEVFLQMMECDQIILSKKGEEWLVKWKTAEKGSSGHDFFKTLGQFLIKNTNYKIKDN